MEIALTITMQNPWLMRRSDLSTGRARGGRQRAAPGLPDAIHREFVEALFEMALPVLGLGVVYVGVALVAARAFSDPILSAFALAGGLVTAGRLALIAAYRRRRQAPAGDRLRAWERRYAAGSYVFALLLAAINLRALAWHEPILHLVTVSLVFGYGAGIVARISIRPRICATSMLLAAVPTVVALLVHAGLDRSDPAHFQLFLVEAALLAVITGLSIQTMLHLYRTATRHLTTEHDLAHLAKRDALTGLANRLLLRERFEACVTAPRIDDAKLAVLCLDLDGFKPVNDTLGHPAGDALLRAVAQRLSETVRAEDTVARLGGDEFVILQTQVTHADEMQMLARRIIRTLSQPYDIEGKQARISASIGIAVADMAQPNLDYLLSSADTALYLAKADGKGRARFAATPIGKGASRVAA